MASDYRLIDRLTFMLEMIDRIQRQVSGMNGHQFGEDKDVIDTTMFRLAQIGESALHLPLDVTERHPGLPWKKMRGLRNLIAHEYQKIEVGRIWDTAQTLPELRQALVHELARLDP